VLAMMISVGTTPWSNDTTVMKLPQAPPPAGRV